MASNMKTRSSVTTFPEAPGRERTAAQAAQRRIEGANAHVIGRQAVRQSQAARVVHMGRAGLFADGAAHLVEQAPHLRRIGHARGVRQADFVGARSRAFARHPDHVVFLHLALDRAAERSGHAGFDLDARRDLVAQAGDGAHLGDHLFAGLADVGHGMGGTGGDRNRQFVHPGAQGAFGAAGIGHQRHDGQAGVLERVANDFGRVGHLRQQPGRHERAHFDFAQAAGDQRVDPAQFLRRGHGGLHRLQAVARADFADQDFGRTRLRIHGVDFLDVLFRKVRPRPPRDAASWRVRRGSRWR